MKWPLMFMVSFFLFTSGFSQDQPDKSTEEETQLWEFAEGLYERTWYEDALTEYRNFLKKFPASENSQDARWRLYQCYSKLGREAEELKILDEFILKEKDPQRRETARMNKARVLFAAKKFDEALKIYEKTAVNLKKGELWETARYEAARIFLRKGKQGEAFLRFRQLANIEYGGKSAIRAYAIFAYASLLSEKKQFKEALKEYSRLIETKGTPEEISENALFNTGGIFFRTEKYAEAEKVFVKLLDEYPQGRFQETSINQAARCYISQSKYNEATDILKKLAESTGIVALERDYLRGYILWQQKNFEEAVVLFDVCIENENDKYKEEAWHNKINCLSEAGENEKALAEAGKFLSEFKQTQWIADVNYTAGAVAKELKKYKEAEEFYQKALETYTGEWPLIDNAYFALAGTQAEQKKFKEEANTWGKLSKRKRSEYRSTALLRGADAWIKAGDAVHALEMLNIYLIDFPQSDEAFYVKNRIAEIYIINQDYAKASEFLQRVLKSTAKLTDKQKTVLLSVLGRVHYYRKAYKDAVQVLTECLKDKAIEQDVRTDCEVYLGFSQIALGNEDEGVKTLSSAFLDRDDFSRLLSVNEEQTIASLLEKYNHIKAAEKVYSRLAEANSRSVKITGLLGLSRLIAKGEKPEGSLVPLGKVLELCKEEDQSQRVSALSIMGEVYFKQGEAARALQIFENVLKMKASGEKSMCRSLYGLAAILKKQGDYDKARRYANQVFILYNDDEYSPKAMFLAVQTLVLTSKSKEAAQTAGELKKKFPLYFAKIEVQDYLKENGIKTD